MANIMKNQIKSIDIFLLCFNGEKSRFDQSIIDLLKLYESIFSKQISYIQSLAKSLELDDDSVLLMVDAAQFSELTGGKSGTASKLIGILREKTEESPRPASPKQINFIKNLVKKSELGEDAACKLVGLEAYSELSGGRQGTASKLIESLRKKQKNK